jgi:hypothetical protein
MIGKANNSLNGAYHTVSARHIYRYLAEINYRFKLDDMMPRLGYVAIRTPPLLMRQLAIAEAP